MKKLILSIVVALSLFSASASAQYPLQTIGSIQAATTAATSLSTADAAATLNLLGFPGAAIQITGTWTGTITFEVSVDGTNYAAANFMSPSGTSAVTTATANGQWTGSVVGFKYLRARFSTASSGTAVVTVRATLGGGSGSGGGGGSGSNAAASATGSAVPSSAGYTGFNSAGNLVGVSSANPLPITVISGGATGGTAIADGATFTAGTTSDTPVAGLYEASPSTCTTGKACAIGLTTNREVKTIVGSALPAGTNAIGKLAANSGVDIGDVDVTSVPTDPFGANADAASATGSISAKLRFIAGTGIPITGTVTVGSHAVTNAGTFAVQADTELPPAATLADNTANPSLSAIASYNMCYDGSTWDRCPASDGGAGASSSNTNRTVEASDSPVTSVLGATSDAATTAGSTGSVAAKLRLMTTQLDSLLTAAQLVDDDQTGATGTGVTSAASNNSTSLKGSAGRLMGMYLTNTTTTTYFMRFYNSSSAPTCSSATGYLFTMAIPPAGAAGQAGGFSMPFGPSGLAFGTGIGYCITAGGSSTDNTSAATGVFGVVAWK